ncbi:MAG: hypothetical protein EA395_01930 [Phormidium sp. GEM2.Bin31]|nr:NAD(P)-binding protein [Phormidium sp. BM_Day4_Bin.17]TVR14915.1 MAG: hypothetical protein EA395_01930 [Phormidium sp. GEM2.Bin31]UCJ11563.1 MAG: NAD(P)-binding protein [Phormidium sp. PBR-2020]
MTKVVVSGGGMTGMSAAQELVERGFEVEVYELKDIPGGKARSIDVSDSAGLDKKRLDGDRTHPRLAEALDEEASVDSLARS